MCLIAFAIGAVPGHPLLIASNRDEHLARPTLPLHAWQLDNGTPVVAVSGRVAVSGLRLSDSSRPDALQPLLSWDRLELDIERAEPLRQRAVLGGLRWQGPQIDLLRDGDGALALPRIAQAFTPAPAEPPAASPAASASPGAAGRRSPR